MDNIMSTLQENLKNFKGEKIVIVQDGFLQSKFTLNSLIYDTENDLLNITDNASDCYLKINLNQVYKIEDKDEKIELYIDNDTTISLER